MRAEARFHTNSPQTAALPSSIQSVLANLAEELSVALHAAVGADGQNAGAVDGEECAWEGAREVSLVVVNGPYEGSGCWVQEPAGDIELVGCESGQSVARTTE